MKVKLNGGSDRAHEDWVRDVAWCNNLGVMNDLIATVGEDNKLKIWKAETISQKLNQDRITQNWNVIFE